MQGVDYCHGLKECGEARGISEMPASMDKLRPISTEEKLTKTTSIWLLAAMGRAGAVHILKDREPGIFIVRKSSHPRCLALSVQSKKSDHSTVDHYLIQGSDVGFRLQGSAHSFHSLPSLLAYYMENIDEIPYYLRLPVAIQQAKSARELTSLDMLGQDFWISSFSLTLQSIKQLHGVLYKSSSEPISIQRPVGVREAGEGKNTEETASCKSALDFSDFMRLQLATEQHFGQNMQIEVTERHVGNRKDALPKASVVSVEYAQTPSNISTTNVSKTVQPFCQNHSNTWKFAKNVSVASDLLSSTSNLEHPEFPLNTPQFKISGSNGSLVKTSSFLVLNQSEHDTLSNISSSHMDVSISNSFYYSKDKKDLALNQHNLVNADSSFTSSMQDVMDSSLEGQHVLGDNISKDHAHVLQKLSKSSINQTRHTKNPQLLEIPENKYFTSNLADKLSDYEDIWKNSSSESEFESNSAGIKSTSNADFDGKDGSHRRNSGYKRRKVLKKSRRTSITSKAATLENPIAKNGNISGLTALEQARIIAGCITDDVASNADVLVEDVRNVESMQNDQHLPEGITSEAVVSTTKLETSVKKHSASMEITALTTSCETECLVPGCPVDTSQSNADLLMEDAISDISIGKFNFSQTIKESSKHVVITDMSEALSNSAWGVQQNNTINKKDFKTDNKIPAPSPIRQFSRKKSLSESSLAILLSPPYAEPADAVRLKDRNGKALNVRIKRCSVPAVAKLKLEDRIRAFEQSEMSLNPQQDIASPLYAKSNDCTEIAFSYGTPNVNILSESTLPDALVSQIPSKGTTPELPQAQSKQTLKDTISCLKLGTKKLTRRLSSKLLTRKHSAKALTCNEAPSKADSFKNNQTGLEGVSDLDKPLFNRLASEQTYAKPSNSSLMNHQQTINLVRDISDLPSIQDLISCAYPELSVRPAFVDHVEPGLKSENSSHYDNLLVAKTSACKNQNTVYYQPYEIEAHNKQNKENGMPSAGKLPLAMNLHRRQKVSRNYHSTDTNDLGVISCDEHITVLAENWSDQFQHQQHQLQQCQTLLTNTERVFMSRKSNDQKCGIDHQYQPNVSMPYNPQQLDKKQNAWQHEEDSENKLTSLGLSSPGLSSHCPDVISCHNTSFSPGWATSETDMDFNSSGILTVSCQTDEDDIKLGSYVDYRRPVLAQHIRTSQNGGKIPGGKIQEYILTLSYDDQTIFGSTVKNFIQCTTESRERNPQNVMRNVRQFMMGIKNYLIKHGEGNLKGLIETEREKLGANDILNVDSLIEQALDVCVLKPVTYHIYHLLVEKYSTSGALENLSRGIKCVRTKSSQDIGVKPSVQLPHSSDMETINHYFDLMQKSYSPFKKLQNFLKATSLIYHYIQEKDHHMPTCGLSSLGADDFLPVLMYVIAQCGLLSAEIEADFMWSLLPPSLLTAEAGYCLTSLSSAVLTLKRFDDATSQMESRLLTSGCLKIAIPDESRGTILWKILPVIPSMSTKDVCAMVAHKLNIANLQDYGLYLLKDGIASQMTDTDHPQAIRDNKLASGISCFFAFKRTDTNIAWPKNM